MKRALVFFVILLGLSGCTSDELAAPIISTDISPINVGVHVVGAQNLPYTFNFQITNQGEEALVIDTWEWKGDQHCAFNFQADIPEEITPNRSAVFRGEYKPLTAVESQIAFIVRSNADNFAEFVIPVCGRGVASDTGDNVLPLQCQVPPDTQPDCSG